MMLHQALRGTHQRKTHRPVPEVGSAWYTSEKDSGLHLRLAVGGTHQRKTHRPVPEVGSAWYTSEKDSQACT